MTEPFDALMASVQLSGWSKSGGRFGSGQCGPCQQDGKMQAHMIATGGDLRNDLPTPCGRQRATLLSATVECRRDGRAFARTVVKKPASLNDCGMEVQPGPSIRKCLLPMPSLKTRVVSGLLPTMKLFLVGTHICELQCACSKVIAVSANAEKCGVWI